MGLGNARNSVAKGLSWGALAIALPCLAAAPAPRAAKPSPPKAAHVEPSPEALAGAAAEERGLSELPETLSLSNAQAPDPSGKPRPNRTNEARALGKARYTLEELKKQAAALQANARGSGIPTPPVDELLRSAVYQSLLTLGPQAGSNRIPEGFLLEITGEIWLGDGGHSAQSITLAENGGRRDAADLTTGGKGGYYASSTTYEVVGDTITMHKAMQIGDKAYLIPAMKMRSGETAIFRLQDGSVMQVTPRLIPTMAMPPEILARGGYDR